MKNLNNNSNFDYENNKTNYDILKKEEEDFEFSLLKKNKKNFKKILILVITSLLSYVVSILRFFILIPFLSLGIILTLVIAIIGSILILAINWNFQKSKDNKILWVILGLLLLGPIALIIFGCIKIY